LIDNSFDDFNEIMIFHYFRGRPRDDVDSRCAPTSPPPRVQCLRHFAIAVAACPLLALLLSVELLNRALKRHRFQAATFHSSRILP
jgi:hypothetical protein